MLILFGGELSFGQRRGSRSLRGRTETKSSPEEKTTKKQPSAGEELEELTARVKVTGKIEPNDIDYVKKRLGYMPEY